MFRRKEEKNLKFVALIFLYEKADICLYKSDAVVWL